MTSTRHLLARVAMFFGCLSAAATAATQTPVPAAAAAPAAVDVIGFVVSGNTLLPQADIEAALESFKGRRSFDELERAAAAVQALYARAGYGAVVAFLPPQAAADGQVAITVVEGRIAKVSVRGAERFEEANILASLPALQPGLTPALRRIDAQLQMANENPAKQTQVLLQPGQLTGEVDAQITVQEAPLQRWTIGADNTGNDSTGKLRASLTWQHANVSGRDDVFTALAQTSPDQPSGVISFSAGYRLPLYARLMALDVYAAYSDIDGGSTATAAGDLRFNGRGRMFGARAGWYLPRWGEVDQRLTVGVDQRTYLNDCAIEGLPEGACGPAGESVTVHPLSVDYVVQSGGAVAWGLNIGLIRNLDLGGTYGGDASFEAVRTGATADYTVLRAGAFVGTALLEEWQVQARASAQWTDDALVPGEQFGLGGATTVRGYQEREVVGDRGALVSLELTSPPLAGDEGANLRLLAFFDAGAVENMLGAQCLEGRTSCRLAGTGVGGRLDAGSLQLSLMAGYALRDGALTDKNSVRVHLALGFSF